MIFTLNPACIMKDFSNIVLLVISLYAIYSFYRIFLLTNRWYHLFLGICSIFLVTISLSDYVIILIPVSLPYFEHGWPYAFFVSFLLASSASLIYDSKPIFSRFPKVFALFPLILLIIFPLFFATITLKFWILALYTGSALFIGLLMILQKILESQSSYIWLLTAYIFSTLILILYLLPDSIFYIPAYLWILASAFSLLFLTLGCKYATQKEFIDE